MNGNRHAIQVISCLDSDSSQLFLENEIIFLWHCHPFPNPFLFTIHNRIPIHCDAVTSKLAEGVMNLSLYSLMCTGLHNVITTVSNKNPKQQHLWLVPSSNLG
jgi:hypothetical protein